MTDTVNIRELVLGILLDVTRDGAYSHIAVRNTLQKYQYLDKKERAFITRVTEGTLERMLEIDFILNQYSKVKTNKMKPVIRNILRSAVYQIKYMDSIPNSAVCNEAVKLAERKGFYQLKGFVNGVLRTIVREPDRVRYPDPARHPVEALSVRYSMPEWIVEELERRSGIQQTKQVLEAFLEESPTTIRCNLELTSPEQLYQEMKAEGIDVEYHPCLPYALQIKGYDYIEKIPAFGKGLFQVQDISSMLVGEAAAPKPGAFCLDICAAPGGKSLHMAEKVGRQGHVTARDLTSYKTDMIRENAERLNINNIKIEEHDALIFDPAMEGQADIVLADLPCSGLGVLRKKTDIKYKMTAKQKSELAALQRNILETIWPYVKAGGTLIYSTCTFSREENEDNLKWFCRHFPFKTDSIDFCLPEEWRNETSKQGWIQLLPGIHDSDGFFIARLIRTE